jgi:hypothetical protein
VTIAMTPTLVRAEMRVDAVPAGDFTHVVLGARGEVLSTFGNTVDREGAFLPRDKVAADLSRRLLDWADLDDSGDPLDPVQAFDLLRETAQFLRGTAAR